MTITIERHIDDTIERGDMLTPDLRSGIAVRILNMKDNIVFVAKHKYKNIASHMHHLSTKNSGEFSPSINKPYWQEFVENVEVRVLE